MLRLGVGGQHLEQPNVERLIFWNFDISSIKRTKDSIFYFVIYFLFLYIFELFEKLKYMIICKIGNLWNFDSSTQTMRFYFLKLLNFRNFMISEVARSERFSESSKMQIFRIFQFGNFRNFSNYLNCKFSKFLNYSKFEIFGIVWIGNFRNLSHFSNWKFLEFCKLQIFRIVRNANFSDFLKFKLFEFSKLQIYRTSQINNFWTSLNWKISRIFSISKTKIWLKKFAILEFFVNLIFCTARNFANSHICPLI